MSDSPDSGDMRKKTLSYLHNWVHTRRDLTDTAITCIGLKDGVGSQLHGKLSTLLFARRYGMRYVHTPFANLEHLPEGADESVEAEAWEDFFNLGDGEVQRGNDQRRSIFLKKPHRAWLRKGQLYEVTHCHRLMQWFPKDYEQFVGEFRRRYWKTAKPDIGVAIGPSPYIAIHLRRGDVSSTGSENFRYTGNEKILAAIVNLRSRHPDWPIHLFSEGDPSSFDCFAKEGVILHLDEDARVSYHAMVCADILITAKSTFSYTAGILNQNLVYYEPSWLPAISGWRVLSESGESGESGD